MSTILVYAIPGRALPREDLRSRLIDGTEQEPNEVPDVPYYRRAVLRGDIGQATREAKAGKAKG